jgi:sugar/nucleoside kinase (ribokinase family)
VTGAGDAFICGYLAALAHGLEPSKCLLLASQWAASAVQIDSSIPPGFDVVKDQWRIDLIP